MSIKSAAIKVQHLRELLEQAYEAGYHGCLDLKGEYVDEAIQKILDGRIEVSAVNPNDGWRIYKINELIKEPIGTIFEHSRLGKCWIDQNEDNPKDKRVVFANGEIKYLQADTNPWDEPMRLLQSVPQG